MILLASTLHSFFYHEQKIYMSLGSRKCSISLPCFNGKLQVEVFSFVNKLLRIHPHFLHQVSEQPVYKTKPFTAYTIDKASIFSTHVMNKISIRTSLKTKLVTWCSQYMSGAVSNHLHTFIYVWEDKWNFLCNRKSVLILTVNYNQVLHL